MGALYPIDSQRTLRRTKPKGKEERSRWEETISLAYIHTYGDPICLSYRKKQRHSNTSLKRPKWPRIRERKREKNKGRKKDINVF